MSAEPQFEAQPQEVPKIIKQEGKSNLNTLEATKTAEINRVIDQIMTLSDRQDLSDNEIKLLKELEAHRATLEELIFMIREKK